MRDLIYISLIFAIASLYEIIKQKYTPLCWYPVPTPAYFHCEVGVPANRRRNEKTVSLLRRQHAYMKFIFLKIYLTFWRSIDVFRILCQVCYPGIARWRHEMETFSALLNLCDGNPPVIPLPKSGSAEPRCFLGLRLNKRLSKRSRLRSFEIPSHSLWCHCNVWVLRWVLINANNYSVKNSHTVDDVIFTRNGEKIRNYTRIIFSVA